MTARSSLGALMGGARAAMGYFFISRFRAQRLERVVFYLTLKPQRLERLKRGVADWESRLPGGGTLSHTALPPPP